MRNGSFHVALDYSDMETPPEAGKKDIREKLHDNRHKEKEKHFCKRCSTKLLYVKDVFEWSSLDGSTISGAFCRDCYMKELDKYE